MGWKKETLKVEEENREGSGSLDTTIKSIINYLNNYTFFKSLSFSSPESEQRIRLLTFDDENYVLHERTQVKPDGCFTRSSYELDFHFPKNQTTRLIRDVTRLAKSHDEAFLVIYRGLI